MGKRVTCIGLAPSTSTCVCAHVPAFIRCFIQREQILLHAACDQADSAALTVQWQSALWGIAAVALNTIVQPAGTVCGLPPSYGTWLRSSPWFCLAGNINVIYAITKNVRYVSLRQAIRAAAESGHQHDAKRGLSSLSQRFVRWLLMAVAIIQMIKLFAYRGLPWTLVFGAM